jgi:hypothetical protein
MDLIETLPESHLDSSFFFAARSHIQDANRVPDLQRPSHFSEETIYI